VGVAATPYVYCNPYSTGALRAAKHPRWAGWQKADAGRWDIKMDLLNLLNHGQKQKQKYVDNSVECDYSMNDTRSKARLTEA